MTLRITLCVVCLLTWSGSLHAQETPAQIHPKSVTVYPVVITPADHTAASIPVRIAEVVGLFLERAGMERVELGDVAFSPPATDDADGIAAAFGKFIATQPLQTEYALFVQILGTPKTGPKEIRTIVVDKTGRAVFADRALRDDLARSKAKPKDPMTASLFVANRVSALWQLADPLREGAPEGKMAQVMKARSGLPPAEDLALMKKRMESVRHKMATSTVTVYPVHLWPGADEASAVQLAKMLTEQGICKAEPSAVDPKIKIAGDPNEQKVLWDAARAFQKFLRGNPPDTQFALLADYGLSPSAHGKQAGHVHLILCDQAGEWVLVDYQNSHHSDFNRINPKSLNECSRLAVLRLKRRFLE
jgi:hypothetical protein